MKIKILIIWNIALTIVLLITAYGVGGLRIAFPLMTDRLLLDEELIVETFDDFQSQLNEQGDIINQHSDTLNEQGDIINQHSDTLDNHTEVLENHANVIEGIQEYLLDYLNKG